MIAFTGFRFAPSGATLWCLLSQADFPARSDSQRLPMAKIHYARVDEFWRREQKYVFLYETQQPANVEWQILQPDSRQTWLTDQYQVSTDKRSGITNDPNREDDPEYIVRLVGQVITVSLETMKIVNALPDLGIESTN
jgi:predicted helicase